MTLYYYDKDGNRHEKPKKSYKTDKEAIYQARILNSLPTTIHKLVAYKCPYCLKWHINIIYYLIQVQYQITIGQTIVLLDV
jgi:hypothetical protein